MTILVTRPSPTGEALVARLRKLGHHAYHSPLIEITRGRELDALPAHLAALHAGNLIIALSQHAVHYAATVVNTTSVSAQTGRRWPSAPTYYAIGRTTALALHQVSSAVVVYPPERETSETLLELPELQNISGKNALLLRGNGGRDLLATTLTERGAQVSFCECYQRRAVHYGPEQSQHWQQLGIDRIIITSGQMLERIYTLVPDYYRVSWLLHCQIIVVSERLAQQAQQLGWHDIRVAENADNDALVRLLS